MPLLIEPAKSPVVMMTSILKKVGYILYQPYKWFVYVPVLLVSTFFFGSLALGMIFIFGPRITSLVSGATWAKVNSFFTPMIVTVTGKHRIDKNQSYVVVSNHQSHFDIFVLYGWLGIDFKWVMKSALRKVPFLGSACDRLEHIYIDRSNTKAAIASINQAKDRIKNGTSVVFFPEGTRSESGQLQAFKKGAFNMARDLDLPILPVTINGTRKILPKYTTKLFPGHAHMIIHPAVDIHAYPKNDLKPLMDDVRSIIQSAIAEQ